jgi:hypothetical protein
MLPVTSGDFVGVSEHAAMLPMIRNVETEQNSLISDLIFLLFLARHFYFYRAIPMQVVRRPARSHTMKRNHDSRNQGYPVEVPQIRRNLIGPYQSASELSKIKMRLCIFESQRSRVTSKPVKLQRPGSGYRVQSLPRGTRPPAILPIRRPT